MVKQTATEDRIEFAIFRDVQGIVLDKFQVRQISLRFNIVAGSDIQFTHVNSKDLESHARELDGVATFQATHVDQAELTFIPREHGLEDSACRYEPRMVFHRPCRLGFRETTV